MTDRPDVPPAVHHDHPRSRRGIWTIVAIFALGFAVLAGLYLSPRSQAPRLPKGLTSGLPQQPVSGVLLDCGPLGASPDGVIAAIRRLAPSPELLLLVDIESSLVPAVIDAFGMQGSYHAELFQRAVPNPASGARIGICILSRHPLFEGTPVRLDRRTIGVETVLVVQTRAMHVRCVAVDDFGELPGLVVHPTAVAGGSPPVVLTAGRIRGKWVVSLSGVTQPQATAGGDDAEPLEEIRREQAPDAVAFVIRGESGRPVTTGPATATAPATTPATSRPAPATDRAE